MKLFTYEIMSEIIGLTHAKDCDAYSLWKNVPLRNFLTYMDVSACKFQNCQLHLLMLNVSHSFLCNRLRCTSNCLASQFGHQNM